MAHVSKTAISKIISEASGSGSGDEGPKKKSREEFKKLKELEEAR